MALRRKPERKRVGNRKIHDAAVIGAPVIANLHIGIEAVEPLIGRMRLDLDHATGRVLAVQRALRAAVDFDAGCIEHLFQRIQVARIENPVDGNTDARIDCLVDARIADAARIKHRSRAIDRPHRLNRHVRRKPRQIGHVLDEELPQLLRRDGRHRHRRVLDGFRFQTRGDNDRFDGRPLQLLRFGGGCLLCHRSICESGQRTSRGSAHNQLTNLHFIPLRFLPVHRSRIEPMLSANTSEANYSTIASQANYPAKPKRCVALKAKRPKFVLLSINIWGMRKLDLLRPPAILIWVSANCVDASVNRPG